MYKLELFTRVRSPYIWQTRKRAKAPCKFHCYCLKFTTNTMIRMFLYAQIYWLAEFGDVSSLQFNYLRVETLTPTWEDLVGHWSDNLVRHLSVWSPTKLSVRPECLIVDTLGGICRSLGTDCFVSCKSNYHTITAMTAPHTIGLWSFALM